MPLTYCHCTFSAQRSTNSSSLSLKLFFKYSRLAIRRTGSRGRQSRAAGRADAAADSPSNAPAKSTPETRCAGLAAWASLGASAASIAAHGSRADNTAIGCRRSLI